ncbi:MAG: GNAT family N-acetyltransferase [Deltaproteobacteria bacterium]|nr:GNAT family N-acetyltransferase [Deltaproteobacteria bacterium]MBW2070034.1 GNAT family N-acetyltransferase [Deltaproteobacteria bacterium]
MNASGDIRIATEKDLPEVLEIERLSFPHPWGHHYLKAALQDLFIIFKKETVMGFLIAVCYQKRLRANIMKVAVHPHHRGKGIARKMLQEALQILQHKGIKEVELDAKMLEVSVVNFYEKLGFRVKRLISPDSELEDYHFFSMCRSLTDDNNFSSDMS